MPGLLYVKLTVESLNGQLVIVTLENISLLDIRTFPYYNWGWTGLLYFMFKFI
jgi:hypothetical protein